MVIRDRSFVEAIDSEVCAEAKKLGRDLNTCALFQRAGTTRLGGSRSIYSLCQKH